MFKTSFKIVECCQTFCHKKYFRNGLKESDVVTKTFNVKEPKERGSDVAQVPHLGKFKSRSKVNKSNI